MSNADETLSNANEASSNEQLEENPFTGVNYNMIQFVQLSRIYDVLMTLVQIQNPNAAQALLDYHRNGDLMGPSPVYTGEFIADGPPGE